MDNLNPPLAPRSAIAHAKAHGNAGANEARVVLEELPHGSIQFSGYGDGVEMAAWLTSAFKVAPESNTVATVLDGTGVLAAVAPATWLLIGDANVLRNIVRPARSEACEVGAVTDFSDGRNCFFSLAGSPAATVLAKYIDIDFEGGQLGPGCCASTGIHDTAVLVVCQRTDMFEIAVHRSLAPSLAEMLIDAAAEYGVNVVRMGA